MESLKSENISKRFGSLYAVHNVCLSIDSGESRAIIGPNGAGKTTLLNLFAGKFKPSSGRIYMFGQDVTATPEHRRVHLGLARTFQVMNLIPNLSVFDNVLLATQGVMAFRSNIFRSQNAYGVLSDQAQSLLVQWELWGRQKDLAQNLSYGEQRRMELVMALASQPRILLLDEPTSGLSEAETASLIAMLRGLEPDTTLIIAEHDMDVVFELADRITVLHYGQVIAEGTKEEIKSNSKVREVYLGEEE